MHVTFRCPHCEHPLERRDQSYGCASGHSFDVAREGYVNLVVGGRRAGGPSGDDDAMVRARRSVFDAGCYDPIIVAVAAAVAASGARTVLDAGCGEGTYLARACAGGREGWGIDISRAAVRAAAKRYEHRFAVASSYRLPFADGSFDAIINVFAPRSFEEMRRVLAPGGVAVVVTPGSDHLAGLKALIYDTPREHRDDEDGPAPDSVESVRFSVDLVEPVRRRQLLEMTPYWWSATEERRALVEAALGGVDAHMLLAVYRPDGRVS